ncbi:hypothetical protein DH2020_035014 [Rehmannia glutinosa]|uniref:WAT1-related protein n=1 Tax=Rehmannia glutinosa TaxID=99300 RepID=A0ABR0V8T4_REHGL
MADAGGGSAVGRRICSIPEKFQLHLAMLALQFGYAGFHVVSRAALNMGISKIVFPVYRNILALLLLLPFAYFLEKYVIESEREATYYMELHHPVLPPCSCRDRKGEIRQKGRNLKGCGYTSLCGGCIGDNTIQGPHHLQPGSAASDQRGGFSGAVGGGAGRRQGQKLDTRLHILDRTLPVVVRLARAAGAGSEEFLVIAAFVERDPQAWLVHSGAELFSVFYAGWPVFVAVYQPVQTLVVAIMASILLGEEFYLGGIIGAVLIISGLYFVLWGKNEERKFAQKAVIHAPADHGSNRITPHIKSSITQPLLSQSTENA